MQTESSRSGGPTTIVRSGSARELAPTIVGRFSGGALNISHVAIDDHIAYAQVSDRHLLHVTLDGRISQPASRSDDREWIRPGDRRGSVSFTPGGQERHGSVGSGRILGLQLELDEQFVEDACEQRLRSGWRQTFNSADAKAFAVAEAAAIHVSQGTRDPLTLDLLLLALARHIGRAYANADRRRDDGWLHPAALARVIEQVRANPAKSISLREMAQSAGIGVSAFVRAFRGSTGVTPAAFALKVRVDHASEILRLTDAGLSEVAAQSGFASAAHLVRTFRSHRGITPGRWRSGVQSRPREHDAQPSASLGLNGETPEFHEIRANAAAQA